jgi:heat shock protein HslJ
MAMRTATSRCDPFFKDEIMYLKFLVAGLATLTTIVPAMAATPAAYAALDHRTERACIAASGFRNASVSPPIRFSDRVGMDARTVTGSYAEPHMNGQSGTMLCLYNRASRRAETQELDGASNNSVNAELKDVLWRGVAINGEAVGSSPITLLLNSDGTATGRSACNNYSVSYNLSGTALRILPDLRGTRMACPPARMAQETLFRAILMSVNMVTIRRDGSLLLQGPSGQSLRFER